MGIDYGNGLTNVSGITVPGHVYKDKFIVGGDECIRYGVIPQNEVLQAWCDDSEAYYGPPHCPACGAELIPDGQFHVGEYARIDGVDGEGKIVKVTETSVFVEIDGRRYRRAFQDAYPCEEQTIDDGHECECGHTIQWVGEECYGDEPLSHYVDADGYKAESDSYGDIFITDSPYFTRCGYCSPCAPGAGYTTDDGDDCAAFCFGPDWFDGPVPHDIFRVSDGQLVCKKGEG